MQLVEACGRNAARVPGRKPPARGCGKAGAGRERLRRPDADTQRPAGSSGRPLSFTRVVEGSPGGRRDDLAYASKDPAGDAVAEAWPLPANTGRTLRSWRAPSAPAVAFLHVRDRGRVPARSGRARPILAYRTITVIDTGRTVHFAPSAAFCGTRSKLFQVLNGCSRCHLTTRGEWFKVGCDNTIAPPRRLGIDRGQDQRSASCGTRSVRMSRCARLMTSAPAVAFDVAWTRSSTRCCAGSGSSKGSSSRSEWRDDRRPERLGCSSRHRHPHPALSERFQDSASNAVPNRAALCVMWRSGLAPSCSRPIIGKSVRYRTHVCPEVHSGSSKG
jgi:hypothetical protein